MYLAKFPFPILSELLLTIANLFLCESMCIARIFIYYLYSQEMPRIRSTCSIVDRIYTSDPQGWKRNLDG